jgi:hypothetical protein
MSEELREQIRNNFNLKDIYELLEIWKTNNRVEWSDMAFDVLREMLREKIREVPLQDKPIFEHEEAVQHNSSLEDWEEKLLANEDQPELYNLAEVITFRRNVNRLIIAAAIVYTLIAALNSQPLRMYFEGGTPSISDIMVFTPDTFIIVLAVLLQIAFIYFPFKAVTHILRILMEMEFNSRKAKQ